jgi:hypothetical protein
MQIGAIVIGARMGLGVDDLRWTMPVRPGDLLNIGSYAKFSVFFRTKNPLEAPACGAIRRSALSALANDGRVMAITSAAAANL